MNETNDAFTNGASNGSDPTPLDDCLKANRTNAG